MIHLALPRCGCYYRDDDYISHVCVCCPSDRTEDRTVGIVLLLIAAEKTHTEDVLLRFDFSRAFFTILRSFVLLIIKRNRERTEAGEIKREEIIIIKNDKPSLSLSLSVLPSCSQEKEKKKREKEKKKENKGENKNNSAREIMYRLAVYK